MLCADNEEVDELEKDFAGTMTSIVHLKENSALIVENENANDCTSKLREKF